VRVPNDRQIRDLHRRYAPTADAFDLVHTHCEIVCTAAEQLLTGLPEFNVELVRAGSLLHDIGVYLLYDPSGRLDHTAYVRHGVLGFELLAELGFPRALCRFCSCHTGVGLSREDVTRQRLDLPIDDYLAETDEELLVMYADKFHSKTTPPVLVTAATYAASVGQFGPDKKERFVSMVERFGEPDLPTLAERYGYAIV
jgi:uncharacterized protein